MIYQKLYHKQNIDSLSSINVYFLLWQKEKDKVEKEEKEEGICSLSVRHFHNLR